MMSRQTYLNLLLTMILGAVGALVVQGSERPVESYQDSTETIASKSIHTQS